MIIAYNSEGSVFFRIDRFMNYKILDPLNTKSNLG